MTAAPGPRRGSLLAGPSEGTDADLLTRARHHTAAPDEKVSGEGVPGGHVEVIVRGHCKVSLTNTEGYRALLSVRGAGDLAGEMAEFSGQCPSATVTASAPVELAAVPHPVCQTFLRSHADAAEQVSRTVGDRLIWHDRRRIDGGAYATEVRLARVPADLIPICGRPIPAGAELEAPLSQEELAGLIGAAVPTVHQSLGLLRRRGLVTTGYRRIVITDADALASWGVLR